jgi:hypothetical protein
VVEQNVLSRNSGKDLSSRKEGSPNLVSTMTGYQQMVDIFIQRAARALSRGRQLVAEATNICGKAATAKQPDEDLAFEGGSTLPKLLPQVIPLNVPESIEIKIFVRKAFVSYATKSSIRRIRAEDSRGKHGVQRGQLSGSSGGKAGNKEGGDPETKN